MPAGEYLQRRGLDLEVANKHHATHLDDAQEVFDLLKDKFGLDRLRAAGLLTRSENFLGSSRPVVGEFVPQNPMKPDYFLPKPSFLSGGNP
jgi:hypothetical protein